VSASSYMYTLVYSDSVNMAMLTCAEPAQRLVQQHDKPQHKAVLYDCMCILSMLRYHCTVQCESPQVKVK
jgi:hypothetical protein